MLHPAFSLRLFGSSYGDMGVEAEVYCVPVYLRGMVQGAGFILGKRDVIVHVGVYMYMVHVQE